MSKISYFQRMFKGVERVSLRHGLTPVSSLIYELFIRLYHFSLFRRIVALAVPKKSTESFLFVLGCYNSGTTVVKDCIALHPDIAKAPVEGGELSSEIPDFDGKSWPRCSYGNIGAINSFRSVGEIDKDQYISDMRPWLRDGKMFVEKSIPLSLVLPAIERAFVDPKYIVVIREPGAVSSGIARKSRPFGVARSVLESEQYPLALLRNQWGYFYRILAADLPGRSRCCVVIFEDFLEDPSGTLERIYDFLGLSPVSIGRINGYLTVGDHSILVEKSQMQKSKVSLTENMYTSLYGDVKSRLFEKCVKV